MKLSRIWHGSAVGLLLFSFSSGVAAADPLVGKTYAEASAKIEEWHGTTVISAVVGDVVGTNDCIVTSWRKSPADHGKIQIALNCNNKLAGPGSPGNSLASPQGRVEKKAQDKIEWLSKHPAYCQKAVVEHPEWGPLEGCDYTKDELRILQK